MIRHRIRLPLAQPPKTLCLLRLSAIGDACHVVPVVRTLQAVWPDTKLTWVIGRTEASLLGDLPGVEFIIFDKHEGRAAIRKLRAALAGRRFDVLLQLQAALRASRIARLIDANVRLGYDRPRAKDFQWVFTNARISGNPRVHQIDTMFAFLEALGIEQRVLEWNIPIPESARTYAADRFGNDRWLVISPCSSERRNNFRNWPAERYAQVVDAAAAMGLRVALTGGGSELERWYGEEITRLASRPPLNLIGRTNLKQLLAVLERAEGLLAPDSGPAHMATAVGTPVIGLYASSNPDRTGPYLSRDWVINRYPETLEAAYGKPVEAQSWGRRVRKPDVMERITVEDVLERLQGLMT